MPKGMGYSHHSDGKGTGIGAGTIGNYDAPAHRATTVRGSYMMKESSGVGYGLSALSGFDGEEHGPKENYDRNPLTGNASERFMPFEYGHSNTATEKGHKFTIW